MKKQESLANAAREVEAEFIARGTMSPRAIRELTGLSLAEVYREIARGTFTSRRIGEGRGIRVYRASVDKWLRDGLRGHASSESFSR